MKTVKLDGEQWCRVFDFEVALKNAADRETKLMAEVQRWMDTAEINRGMLIDAQKEVARLKKANVSEGNSVSALVVDKRDLEAEVGRLRFEIDAHD